MVAPVGLSMTSITTLIGNLFNSVLIGNEILIGAIIMIFIIIWIARSGSSTLGVMIVGGCAMIMLLVGLGYLPDWIMGIILIIIAFIIYQVIAKLFLRI